MAWNRILDVLFCVVALIFSCSDAIRHLSERKQLRRLALDWGLELRRFESNAALRTRMRDRLKRTTNAAGDRTGGGVGQ